MRNLRAIRRNAARHTTLLAVCLAAGGFLGAWAIARDGFDTHARYLDTPRYAT